MNTKPILKPTGRLRWIPLALPLLLGAAAWLSGCDVGSVDSTSAVVSDNSGVIYNFSGLYMHPDNTGGTNSLVPLVYPQGAQSGMPLTWMRLLQYGSVLEAYDNENQKWTGKIAGMQGATASFHLRGKTTAGMTAEIVGNMTYADQKSSVNAAWIEPQFSSSFIAQATVSPVTTNAPVSTLAISPSETQTLTTNQTTVAFTAQGGLAPYQWAVDDTNLGAVSSSTGTSTTYTRTTQSGTNRLRLTDAAGSTRDVSILSQ